MPWSKLAPTSRFPNFPGPPGPLSAALSPVAGSPEVAKFFSECPPAPLPLLGCREETISTNNQCQGRNSILDPESSAVEDSEFALIQRTRGNSMKLSARSSQALQIPPYRAVGNCSPSCNCAMHTLAFKHTQPSQTSRELKMHLNKAPLPGSFPLQPGSEGER